MISEEAAELIGESFLCPITFELIQEPAICVDGHSYEKAAIAEWLKGGHKESPRTNIALESVKLTGNLALKQSIQAWNSVSRELGASGGQEQAGAPVAAASEVAVEDENDKNLDAGYPENEEKEGAAASAKKSSRRKKKKKPVGGASPAIEAFSNTLVCPLTKVIMQDPVVCADGHSYERTAIEERLESGNMVSVRTGSKLAHKLLIPNIQLRQSIEAWLQAKPQVDNPAASAPSSPVEAERTSSQPKPDKKAPLSVESSLERLVDAAALTEFSADQKEWFLAKMNDAADLQTRLTAKGVCSLVERNPSLALECLIKLASKHHINQYLTALVAMSMSFNSMDLVNRLVHSVDAPPNFIQGYVIKCVRACSLIRRDKEKQSQFVRRLCALLYQLIRGKKFTVKTHLVELQAFCIEFAHVKEASTLHRLLKACDIDENS